MLTADDRQAPDALAHHVVGRLTQGVVEEDHDGLTPYDVANPCMVRLRSKQVAPRHDTTRYSSSVVTGNPWWCVPPAPDPSHVRTWPRVRSASSVIRSSDI